MFKATILNSQRILYEGPAWSVFLPGSTGEFEVLEFHKTIVSLLRKGDIVIDREKAIPVKKGVVKMRHDELVAIVEE